MLTYDIEIQNLETGETKRMDSCVGWNQHSETVWRTRFCDCNLAGYFFRQCMQTNAGSIWEPHNFPAYDWRKRNGGVRPCSAAPQVRRTPCSPGRRQGH